MPNFALFARRLYISDSHYLNVSGKPRCEKNKPREKILGPGEKEKIKDDGGMRSCEMLRHCSIGYIKGGNVALVLSARHCYWRYGCGLDCTKVL